MAWVRSEYAGELAVVSAWLSMLLPWNVVYQPDAPVNSTVVFFRFSVFELQVRFPFIFEVDGEIATAAEALALEFPGAGLVWGLFVTTPVGAIIHYGEMAVDRSGIGQYLYWGSLAWAVAAVVLLAAFVVSIALYLREARFEQRSPVDPVRLIGGLLAVATLATAAATVLYALDSEVAGVPIPVGVLLMGGLAVALLRVERR